MITSGQRIARCAARFTIGLPSLLLGTASGQPAFDDVLAIFEERCVICHSGQGAPLGLRLDRFEGLMAGSEGGPVVDDPGVGDYVEVRGIIGPDGEIRVERLRTR